MAEARIAAARIRVYRAALSNAGKIFFYAGDNDPYVPLDRTRAIATQLQAPLSVIEGGGHLNSESGYTEFDKLKEDLLAAFPL